MSKAKTIVAQQDSTCFSDLRFKKGVAYFTFARDGYTETATMSRQEFKEWVQSNSLGQWYNANLR